MEMPAETVTPETEIAFELGGSKLRTIAILSIRQLAENLKDDLSRDEIWTLVGLLVDRDPEESEPEPEDEPEDSDDSEESEEDAESDDDGEPDESEDGEPEDGEPEPADDGDPSGSGDDDGQEADDDGDGEDGVSEDNNPYGHDYPYDDDDSDDYEPGEEDDEEDGDEKEVPYAPKVFPGGGESRKREQQEYPQDILDALELLGLDPSKL